MPVIVVALGYAALAVLGVLRSVLRGQQDFGQLGLNQVLEGASRLALGLLLVSSLGLGVNGSLLAYLLAYLIAGAAIAPTIRGVFGQEKATIDTGRIYRYAWPALLVTVCLLVMLNADLILVKRFFDPLRAGHYAALVTLARPINFLADAICVMLFPTVTGAWVKGERTTRILTTAVAYVAALSLLVTLAYFLFPSIITSFVFGSRYMNAAPLLGPLAVTASLFALVSTYAKYQLAIDPQSFLTRLVVPLMIGSALEVFLLGLFHRSLLTVIGVLALTYSVTIIPFLLSMIVAWQRPHIRSK